MINKDSQAVQATQEMSTPYIADPAGAHHQDKREGQELTRRLPLFVTYNMEEKNPVEMRDFSDINT
jgi:hypothetical protein